MRKNALAALVTIVAALIGTGVVINMQYDDGAQTWAAFIAIGAAITISTCVPLIVIASEGDDLEVHGGGVVVVAVVGGLIAWVVQDELGSASEYYYLPWIAWGAGVASCLLGSLIQLSVGKP